MSYSFETQMVGSIESFADLDDFDVNYDISVVQNGYITGDNYNQEQDFIVTSTNITIELVKVYVDGYEIEISPKSQALLEKTIKEKLDIN